MHNYVDSPTLINCTFSANSANQGGGMFNDHSNPTLTNCILWADIPEEVYMSGGTALITYSDVQGGWSGIGNIYADPLFADADLRLSAGSPCIDAGDKSAVLVATDLDGNPRIVGLEIDMGAYEFQELSQHAIAKTEQLIDEVVGLNLQQGIENGLVAKLEAALRVLDDLNVNNDVAAIPLLEAFINVVEAQRGKQISTTDADALITAALEIIELLSTG